MIDWFNFNNFYSFLYIIFLLLGIAYLSNYVTNCTTDSDACDSEEVDCTDEEDCLTIKMNKSDLIKTIDSIKKLQTDMKNIL